MPPESPDSPDFQASPLWPERLARSAAALCAAPAAARDPLRAALWQVLHAALYASLRSQSHRVPIASREDLEDIASAKALEILSRAEDGSWSPAGRPAHEIAGFVARVARNGLIDLARRRGREVAAPADEVAWRERPGPTAGAVEATPEDRVSANEFVKALSDCIERLTPRSRAVWFQRVFLEAPSRDIAGRCGVHAAHVDVLVQRARTALRQCMSEKGHGGTEARPGVFAALWPAMTQWSREAAAREDDRTHE